MRGRVRKKAQTFQASVSYACRVGFIINLNAGTGSRGALTLSYLLSLSRLGAWESVQGSGLRVQSSGVSEFKVQGSNSGFNFRVICLEFSFCLLSAN